jgi:hypothetical protein
MSKFTMPVAGTPEFDALKARWSAKPVSFGQCGRIKTLFKMVADQGGYAGKVNAKYQARLDYLSTRNDEGRWTVLRTDNPELDMTMWQAHMLMETLETLANGDLAIAKTEPVKPEPAKRDAILEVASKVNFSDGDFVTVNGEAFRVSTTGKRAYLARV